MNRISLLESSGRVFEQLPQLERQEPRDYLVTHICEQNISPLFSENFLAFHVSISQECFLSFSRPFAFLFHISVNILVFEYHTHWGFFPPTETNS